MFLWRCTVIGVRMKSSQSLDRIAAIGWSQRPTIDLVADSPATAITIPDLVGVRKYFLLISPAEGVTIVMDPDDTDGWMISDVQYSKPYGVWNTTTQLYAYSPTPTPIRITPYISAVGQLTKPPTIGPRIANKDVRTVLGPYSYAELEDVPPIAPAWLSGFGRVAYDFDAGIWIPAVLIEDGYSLETLVNQETDPLNLPLNWTFVSGAGGTLTGGLGSNLVITAPWATNGNGSLNYTFPALGATDEVAVVARLQATPRTGNAANIAYQEFEDSVTPKALNWVMNRELVGSYWHSSPVVWSQISAMNTHYTHYMRGGTSDDICYAMLMDVPNWHSSAPNNIAGGAPVADRVRHYITSPAGNPVDGTMEIEFIAIYTRTP